MNNEERALVAGTMAALGEFERAVADVRQAQLALTEGRNKDRDWLKK